jgi:hypothetical protein
MRLLLDGKRFVYTTEQANEQSPARESQMTNNTTNEQQIKVKLEITFSF